MSIIEREIAERQEALDTHGENVALLEEAKAKVAELEKAVAEFDAETLIAEIEELKTYLPHEEVVEEKAVEETVEE